MIRAWRNWQPQILNYFDNTITNAYTESLNNLIRVMSCLGRGYSFEALRAKILFAEGAYKVLHLRLKFEGREIGPARIAAFATTGYEGLDTFVSSSLNPDSVSRKRNYGVDISTVAQMIEDGRI